MGVGILALGIDKSGLLGNSSLLSLDGTALLVDGSRVELGHNSEILERVLLELDTSGLLDGRFDNALDLIRVDDTTDISIGHHGTGQVVVGLHGGSLGVGSVQAIELLKGTLSPDAETSKMTTRGQLKEVQSLNVAQFNTRDVSEGLDETLVLVVDDQRTTSLGVTSVPHLTLTTAEFLGGLDFLDIIIGTEFLEKGDGVGGFGQLFDSVADNKGDLVDLLNSVTTGHDQSGDGRGSQSRSNSVSSLVDVDLGMPFTPDLGGGEHTSTTAHVSESSLSGSVGTTTGDTGDTRNGTSGTPGFSGGLVTSALGNTAGLTVIFGHA